MLQQNCFESFLCENTSCKIVHSVYVGIGYDRSIITSGIIVRIKDIESKRTVFRTILYHYRGRHTDDVVDVVALNAAFPTTFPNIIGGSYVQTEMVIPSMTGYG